MAHLTNDSIGQAGWNVSDDNIRIANHYEKVAYSCIASFGIAGNLMVIFVIARSVTMRKTYTNMLILNQSGIDLMASILILITTMIKDYDDDLTGIMGDL